MRKILTFLILPMLLSGCVGSQFVVDETDNEATFPSLHDVPERPDLPDRSTYPALKDDLSSSQQETLDENEKLRKKYGL